MSNVETIKVVPARVVIRCGPSVPTVALFVWRSLSSPSPLTRAGEWSSCVCRWFFDPVIARERRPDITA